MAEPTNYRYGVIRTLDEARDAAAEAEADGLLGWYPAACVVLARELKRWEEAHAEWLERSRTQAHPEALLNLIFGEYADACMKWGADSDLGADSRHKPTLDALEARIREAVARGVAGTLPGLRELLLELRPMTAYGVVGSRDVDQARYRAAIDKALLELAAKNGSAAAIDKLAAGVTPPLTDDRISNHEQPLRQDNAPARDGGSDRAGDRSGELRHGATEPDGAVGVVDGRQGAARAHDAAGPAAVPAGPDADQPVTAPHSTKLSGHSAEGIAAPTGVKACVATHGRCPDVGQDNTCSLPDGACDGQRTRGVTASVNPQQENGNV